MSDTGSNTNIDGLSLAIPDGGSIIITPATAGPGIDYNTYYFDIWDGNGRIVVSGKLSNLRYQINAFALIAADAPKPPIWGPNKRPISGDL